MLIRYIVRVLETDNAILSFQITIQADFDIHKPLKEKRMGHEGEKVILKKHFLKNFTKTSSITVKFQPMLDLPSFNPDMDTPFVWDIRMLPINVSQYAQDKPGRQRPPPVSSILGYLKLFFEKATRDWRPFC